MPPSFGGNLKTKEFIKKNDLIQLTDGDTMDSFIMLAEDFSKGVAGNWDLAMSMLKAMDKSIKALMARIEKLENPEKPKKKEK